MAKRKTTSPTSTKEGCLCKDGTYSTECCTGEVIAQGVGATESQSQSTITNVNTPRTITGVNG